MTRSLRFLLLWLALLGLATQAMAGLAAAACLPAPGLGIQDVAVRYVLPLGSAVPHAAGPKCGRIALPAKAACAMSGVCSAAVTTAPVIHALPHTADAPDSKVVFAVIQFFPGRLERPPRAEHGLRGILHAVYLL